MNTPNNQYSSRMGAILTMIGVAVGLGNVWRFPYMMGTYGGSAFLLIYLLFTLTLAFPALLTEMLVGKQSQSSTLFTILTAQKMDGLQVYNRANGKWIRLNPEPGSPVNITGMIMRWRSKLQFI